MTNNDQITISKFTTAIRLAATIYAVAVVAYYACSVVRAPKWSGYFIGLLILLAAISYVFAAVYRSSLSEDKKNLSMTSPLLPAGLFLLYAVLEFCSS
jgi:hypothetical protein